MKKLFTNKNFIQKAIIAIVIILLFTFCVPTRANADVGGVLLGPIFDLLSSIGDAILAGLNAFLVNGEFIPDNESLFDITLVTWKQAPFNGETTTDRPELNEAAYNTSGAMAEPKKFAADYLNGVIGDGDIKVPFTRYSPEKIFSGAVPAFDVNFVDPKDWSETLTDEEQQALDDAQSVLADESATDEEKEEAQETVYRYESAKNDKSIALILHETIAKWYVALRNLAIVGMLIILLYVGIRIIISSTASDKAKYKEFLKDWLIALCLLFTLHYIMTFTVTVVNSITEAIAGENPSQGTNNIPVLVADGSSTENLTEDNAYFKFNTDIMGYARFLVQYDDIGTKVLYFIIYIAMVIYTVMFTITYLKRSLTMAFLTIIAPLIALTYPIDKIGDGSAQGFNAWLKEYVYNALIQPFHLIIYTVFAGSAVVDLSADNPIYAIIVLAFISQSEKMLRKFFGFDKASTAGSLGSFAGGAAAMSLTQKLIGSAAHRKKGGSGGAGASNKIRTQAGSIEDNNSPGLGDFADARVAGAGSSGTTGGSVLLGGANPSVGQNGGPSSISSGSRGVQLQPGETMVGGVIVPSGVSASSPTPSQTPTRTAQASSASAPKDTRGLGQYTRDWAGGKAAEARAWLGKTGAANAVRQFTNAGGQKVHDLRNKLNNSAAGRIAGQAAARINSLGAVQPLKNSVRGAGAVMADLGKKGLKAAPRVAGRAALGALGASVGIAAGIAGDDLNDIVKFGAAGAGLGSTLGYDAVTGLGSSIAEGASEIRSTYNTATRGLNAAQLAEQRRELMKDKDRMNRLNDLIPTDDGHERSAKEKKELLAKSIDYTEAGITDEKKIAKAMKLEATVAKDLQNVAGMTDQEKAEAAKKRAMIAAQFAERVDDKKLVNEEYVEQVTQSWARGMLNPENGINQAQARKEAENMMKYVKKLKKVN